MRGGAATEPTSALCLRAVKDGKECPRLRMGKSCFFIGLLSEKMEYEVKNHAYRGKKLHKG